MEAYTPLWVLATAASIITLCGSGVAMVKLLSHIGDKWLEWRTKKRDADRTDEEADERSSANEAWGTVDRLTEELQRVEPRMTAMEEKVEQCQRQHAEEKASHAGTRRALRIVIAVFKDRKMKFPPELEEELQRNGNGPGHLPSTEGGAGS